MDSLDSLGTLCLLPSIWQFRWWTICSRFVFSSLYFLKVIADFSSNTCNVCINETLSLRFLPPQTFLVVLYILSPSKQYGCVHEGTLPFSWSLPRYFVHLWLILKFMIQNSPANLKCVYFSLVLHCIKFLITGKQLISYQLVLIAVKWWNVDTNALASVRRRRKSVE